MQMELRNGLETGRRHNCLKRMHQWVKTRVEDDIEKHMKMRIRHAQQRAPGARNQEARH
jgi:hypothetical protein